jgi:glycogen(starch) synthase
VARWLICSWEYPPVIEGGLARHVGKLAGALARQGHDVHVLTRGAAGEREERAGVVVHRVGAPDYPRRDFTAFLEWVTRMNADLAAAGEAAAAEAGFDVVHSHDWLVARAGERLARRLGAPWLVTVHATEHLRHQGWVRAWPQSHLHAEDRRMLRRADRVIACSAAMRRHVKEVFGVEAAVVPNGIDPADFAPAADLPRLRARFAAPGEPLVLLAGRLVHEKGFHLALDALPQVMQRVGPVCFVVAGRGTAEQELRAQVRRLGLLERGTFLGWVGDELLHGLYRVADLCVVPSLQEPFGLVALEAMASGCACLVADTGGLREIVGPAGLRFTAGSVASLAAAMERALSDPDLRRRAVDDGWKRVHAHDWDVAAQRTADVIAAIPRRAASCP